MTIPEDIQKLRTVALEASQNAYAPHSDYQVGAAILSASGKIFHGCNIENSSYGATVCAERVALWKAWSEGERDFATMVIVANGVRVPFPCGICRQVLWELAKSLEIVVFDSDKIAGKYLISNLMPNAF